MPFADEIAAMAAEVQEQLASATVVIKRPVPSGARDPVTMNRAQTTQDATVPVLVFAASDRVMGGQGGNRRRAAAIVVRTEHLRAAGVTDTPARGWIVSVAASSTGLDKGDWTVTNAESRAGGEQFYLSLERTTP